MKVKQILKSDLFKSMAITTIIFGILAVCVLLQSCAKEELDLNKLNQFSEPKNITVSASLPQASNTSKTTIAFNDNGKVLWETNDSISVNGTTLSNITVSSADRRNAKFSGEVSPLSTTHYWGVYPTSIATDKNVSGNYTTSAVKVNLPTTQTYQHDTIPSFMVAYCSTSDDEVTLTFKNLCSIIKIPVQAASGFSGDSAQLKKIEITSTQNISGIATVRWNNGAPTMSISKSKKIILDCGNTDVTSQKYFYIMVPTGSSTQDLTVNFYDNTGYYMQKKITGANLTRSRIHTTNPVTLNTRTDALWESGDFSVSANLKVRFSSGNLQWSAKGGGSSKTTHAVAGGGTADGTWRFAEHQYDYVGDADSGNVYIGSTKCSNTQISSSYAGWIDLFGWGTSGWDNGNYFYMPYDSSGGGGIVGTKGYGYGPTNGSTYKYGLTGTYANSDWGKYNAIQEGSTTHPAGTWRTLTRAEWMYLFNTGNSSSSYRQDANRFAKARLNGVRGLLVFPDGYNGGTAISGITGVATVNSISAAHPSDNISNADWAAMEASGVVFLPSSGYRDLLSVGNCYSDSYYWSSTYSSISTAYCILFYSGNVYSQRTMNRSDGIAVRLVRNVN